MLLNKTFHPNGQPPPAQLQPPPGPPGSCPPSPGQDRASRPHPGGDHGGTQLPTEPRYGWQRPGSGVPPSSCWQLACVTARQETRRRQHRPRGNPHRASGQRVTQWGWPASCPLPPLGQDPGGWAAVWAQTKTPKSFNSIHSHYRYHHVPPDDMPGGGSRPFYNSRTCFLEREV